jgi:hypothetical protein
MTNYYEVKPYRDHREDPAISIYVISSKAAKMDKYSCAWCKRTIFDVKGNIDKIITTPMPIEDFDMAINIQCKLCHAKYRLLINSK